IGVFVKVKNNDIKMECNYKFVPSNQNEHLKINWSQSGVEESLNIVEKLQIDVSTQINKNKCSVDVQDLSKKSYIRKYVQVEDIAPSEENIMAIMNSDTMLKSLKSFEAKMKRIEIERSIFDNLLFDEINDICSLPISNEKIMCKETNDTKFIEIATLCDLKDKNKSATIVAKNPLDGDRIYCVLSDSKNFDQTLKNDCIISSQNHEIKVWNISSSPIFEIFSPNQNKTKNEIQVYSNLSQSHRMKVNDIRWLHSSKNVDSSGKCKESLTSHEKLELQVGSAGKDNTFIIWNLTMDLKNKSEISKNNLILRPIIIIKISCSSEMTLSISKFFYTYEICSESDDDTSKILDGENIYNIIFGTEDGKLMRACWTPEKSLESGRLEYPKAEQISSNQEGESLILEPSVFLPGCYLFITRWNFSIWSNSYKSGPVLIQSSSQNPLIGGCWSAKIPSIFYLVFTDGNIEVWNILETLSTAIFKQIIFSSGKLCHVTSYTAEQEYLILGNSSGSAEIYELKGIDFNESNRTIREISQMTLEKIKQETESRDAKIKEISKRGHLFPNSTFSSKTNIGDGLQVINSEDYEFKNSELIQDFKKTENDDISKILREFDDFESEISKKYNLQVV
ncbi:MAG: WD repeat-containing protein 63, partial [Paramarteilia canceri]